MGQGRVTDEPLVAVLGACGYIGSAVVSALADRPVRLRAVGRSRCRISKLGRADIDVRTADLTHPGELAAAVAGADAVIHLVAQISHTTSWRTAAGDETAHGVNVGLVQDLVDVLRRRGTGPSPVLVFAGTTSQVGIPPRALIDGSENDVPATEYDKHKLAAETVVMRATAEGVVRGVSLRLATVYGAVARQAERSRGVVASMVRKALAGEPLTLWHGGGTVTRDLVHIHDVARAFVAALDHADRLSGGRWLIGTGRGTGMGELLDSVATTVGECSGRPAVPVVGVPAPGHAEPTDFQSYVIDSSRFTAVTGWRPNVALADGLRDTVTALAVSGRPALR
jgi:nucleoside-diphosphate-sugar epimerase